VIITPEPGMHKEIGQKLLSLADNPRDVQWVTWPQAGYSIPLELFVKFDADDMAETLWKMPMEQLEKLATGGIIEPGQSYIIGENGPPALEAPQPRRRGRPRKEEPSTDDNTSEGE
jgi:hypothetical protein